MPTMYCYYENEVMQKPPLHRLSDVEWARAMHKTGKRVLRGDFDIRLGKWRYEPFEPPKERNNIKTPFERERASEVYKRAFKWQTGERVSMRNVAKEMELPFAIVRGIMRGRHTVFAEEWEAFVGDKWAEVNACRVMRRGI